MMQPAFVHLRLHTEFSLVDGIVKIKPLVKRLAELNMPAVAVTDHANLFSLVKFYKTALGQGLKPVAGADVLIFNPDEPATPYRLTLLVNRQQGYVTLTELISKAYQEGQQQGVPMLRQAWLEANHDGLIALSGAMEGDIGKALLAENTAAAQRLAGYWGDLFPQRFYLEVQRVGKPDEERHIAATVDLALATGLPVVATNDVRFLHKADFAAHEVRVCINQGRVLDDVRRPKDYTEQQYLRSSEEMQALFADLPEALANTVEIAKRCNITLTLGENFLPDFPVPAGLTLGEVMTKAAQQGLEERLKHRPAVGSGTVAENRRVYDERLDFELKMITQMGFPGYFMIVADFIQWAKNHGIPVGPGRGSGAGSLVAYALKITDLDPIEFDLLFERFLNPERVSMPDFDIDFCMDRRDEVIQYVAEHYGRDHVAQIITYGSMAAKAVIRDVGRVSGFAYGFVDRLAKLIPFEIGMTLAKALKDSPELKQAYDSEEEVKSLIDMALSLEGTVRNAGKHAGGVVISPTKLTDFTPLYCEEGGGNLVTQFDKDDVEAVGLVKFDFLGLRTLTIIDWALQTINRKQQQLGLPPVDITIIPRDDAATYELLKKGLTTAVFQLESRGMKELIKKLKPDCFDDIVALVALFRPGPLESGMVDDYINVKHGAKAEYAHPLLEPILKPTNGVILYQEQVMQIAREMALYTLGGADMLRRCLSGSTQVVDVATGLNVSLQTIADHADHWLGRQVFSVDLNSQKIVAQPITAIYPNGEREVWEVTTRTQRKIKATSEHLFYTPLGWQTLAQFAVGDRIGLVLTLPVTPHSDISAAHIKPTAGLTPKPPHSYLCNRNKRAHSNVFWDDIVSIEPVGIEAVFDLTIPTTHNFIANDFIAHNCMGKKKPEEMAKERDKFLTGAAQNQIDESISTYVFDLMEKFAGYGFNKTVHALTKICTLAGTKNIKDCRAGDVVLSMNPDGSLEPSKVIALHDHGHVPLWQVEFNDGTIERCTADHKWLTDSGQRPLWQILRMGCPVWGTSAAQTRYLGASKTPPVAPSQTPRKARANVQRLGVYRTKARTLFANGAKNIRACRCAGATRRTVKTLAAGKPRTMGGHSQQNPRLVQTLENGKWGRKRFCAQYAYPLWQRQNTQTRRFCSPTQKNSHPARAFGGRFGQRPTPWPLVTSRNHDPQRAADWFGDTLFQSQHGRVERAAGENRQPDRAGRVVLRRPVRATFVGWHQGYDLEVNHPQHNFLLASGLCCSNSHSAAYALVAYQTAWLKTHHPAAFMAAVLSSDMDNTDKVVVFIEECRQMRLAISPPNINLSEHKFTVNDKGHIVYGLGAIKGVGEAAVEDVIINERNTDGVFSGLYDLCKRVDLRKVNKRVLEALIKAGAFDELNPCRASHLAELPTALRVAEQHGKMARTGQNDLFGLAVNHEEIEDSEAYTCVAEPWSEKERLDAEKSILGLYLTGHPIEQYEAELAQFTQGTIASLLGTVERSRGNVAARVAGLVVEVRTRQTKSGKTMGFATLDDRTGRLECAAFGDTYDRHRDILAKDKLVIAEGSVAIDGFSGALRLSVDKLYDMDQARAEFARSIHLRWTVTATAPDHELINRLAALLADFKGGSCPLELRYQSPVARATLRLGDEWRVSPATELLTRLQVLFGKANVELKYR